MNKEKHPPKVNV